MFEKSLEGGQAPYNVQAGVQTDFFNTDFYHSCYFSESENGIFNAILSGQIDFASDPWPAISHQAKDLVRKMLNSDPKQRLTAAQVLSKHLLSTIYIAVNYFLTCFCFPLCNFKRPSVD